MLCKRECIAEEGDDSDYSRSEYERAGAGFAKQNRSYTQEPCYVKQGNEANEGIIANTKHKREIDHIYIVVTLFSFEGTSKIFAKQKSLDMHTERKATTALEPRKRISASRSRFCGAKSAGVMRNPVTLE